MSQHNLSDETMKTKPLPPPPLPPPPPPPPPPQVDESILQCFMCDDESFKTEDELNDHINSSHMMIDGDKTNDESLEYIMDDVNSIITSDTAIPSSSSSSSTRTTQVIKSSSGRPCEICGFEPKTKNKSRERQDHLAMKHYKERIAADLATIKQFHCPVCDYVGKDKQTIYRHYTGKHKVVEGYLAEDLASGKIVPINNTNNDVAAAAAAPITHNLPSFEVTTAIIDNEGNNGTITNNELNNSFKITQVDGTVDDIIKEELPTVDIQVPNLNTIPYPPDYVPPVVGEPPYISSPPPPSQQPPPPSNFPSCPLCHEEMKPNRNYHNAYRHFRNRLCLTVPLTKPFNCPECDFEAKQKINLWMHYLGRHGYGDQWTKATLNGEMEREQHDEESVRNKSSKTQQLRQLIKQSSPTKMTTPDTTLVTNNPILNKLVSAPSPQTKAIKTENNKNIVNKCSSSSSGGGSSNYNNTKENSSMEKNFWCDLCQANVTNTPKPNHFANTHFEERLKAELGMEKPHVCPYCNYEAKQYYSLHIHYLNKHGLLDLWIREAMEKITIDLEVKKEEESSSLNSLKRKNQDNVSPQLIKFSKLNFEEDELLNGKPRFLTSKVINRDPVPTRVMISHLSKKMHPNVDHYWICDGRLLVISDTSHPDAVKLFQVIKILKVIFF